jgi:hypothetical protein
MSNQTVRKPPARSSQSSAKTTRNAAPSARYRRQTAHGGNEFRRDGKPLIFGWGGHLTRLEKQRLQTRAAYGLFSVIVVAVLGIFAFGLLQQNVLIPNQAIATVNGTGIAQDTYRKYLAYEAQALWNTLQSELTQEQVASTKSKAGDQTAALQDQILISQIQTDEGNYGQSTITANMSQQLVEDQLIQQGIAQFEAHGVPASKFTISNSDIQKQLDAFKKAFPAGQTYQQFKAKDNLSDADVRAAIAVDLRRTAMQKYLSASIVSPTKQVHLRRIQVSQSTQAAQVRAKLIKDPSNQNWTTLAKSTSLDAATKTVGGDMGWVFQGGSDSAIENWAFGSGVKINDISPVIHDSTGTYDVMQLLGVDVHRTVDASTLSAAQGNALNHWLAGQKVAPHNKVGSVDQTMLTAARNLPAQPNLNATLPNFNPSTSTGG